MMDFLCKKELNAKDFTFCGEGLPINLSLNARSAVLFFQFSQTLAGMDNLGNSDSTFWLCTFRLELDHFAALKQSKELGLWNRLYIDHLFTCWKMTFSTLEWDTLRCWTFNDFTCPNFVPWKVRDLVDKLNAEMLSNTSPDLRRLYHLVLQKDFYNDNFTDNDDDNNWDLITSEATDFNQHTSTLQSVELNGTSEDADAAALQADGTSPTLQAMGSTSVELPVTEELHQDLVDEVFITSGGAKFHFVECKGLTSRTHELQVIGLDEAKTLGRTLCQFCSELKGLRTTQCCSPGCNFKPTWDSHFCCRKCRDQLTGGHGRLCSRVTYHPPLPVPQTSGGITFTRNSAGSVI
jgi:hypothetical protein